jgi:hypothetical protein
MTSSGLGNMGRPASYRAKGEVSGRSGLSRIAVVRRGGGLHREHVQGISPALLVGRGGILSTGELFSDSSNV